MNEITKNTDYELLAVEDQNIPLQKSDMMAICNATECIVANISDTINNVAATMRDISVIKARVDLETKQLEHAFDCMMLKAKKDVTIYRDTLPLLEKNFSSMQDRMDRLMDRAMDLICEDVSDLSLNRQEMIMNLIEITNNTINSLISKLLPTH